MKINTYKDTSFEKDICTIDICNYIQKYFKTIKNKNILDFGCGMGDKSFLLNSRDNKVIQTDIEDLRKVKELPFILSKSEIINAEDNTYDYVASIDVIEHVENDKNFIKEILRVLKPGGKAFITTPNKYRIGNILKIIKDRKLIQYPLVLGYSEGLKECIHIREYTPKTLSNLVSNKELKNIKVYTIWLGLRLPLIELIRIPGKIPFPLSYMCQSLVLTFEKS